MKTTWPAFLLIAASAAAALPVREAQACGACFAPPSSPTVVSGHRMVMSISTDQTVLWDQIQYQGEPEDFAWVLPVKPGARVEEASDAFFETLEAMTRTTVLSPPVSCVFDDGDYYGGEDGCSGGCGALAAGDDGEGYGGASSGGPPADPVEVIHQGSVGPYETVTLATDVPGALNDWLTQHGYNVDATAQPIIDQYVAEGFDFIALRLQPGLGVQQMKPVRVVSQGANFSLPLRMVAIGTGAQTPVVLYVVSEGRYGLDGFASVSVPTDALEWDFATSSSNYASLRQTVLSTDGGQSALTSFATRAFFTEYARTSGGTMNGGGPPQQVSRFLPLYAEQLRLNGEAGSCSIAAPLTGKVGNPCAPGEALDSPTCTGVDDGEIDARDLGCPGGYDVSMALLGLNVEDAWITRIEGDWPRKVLESDLRLVAAAQVAIDSSLLAPNAKNPDAACPGGSAAQSAPPLLTRGGPKNGPLRSAPALGAAAIGLLLRRILGERARLRAQAARGARAAV